VDTETELKPVLDLVRSNCLQNDEVFFTLINDLDNYDLSGLYAPSVGQKNNRALRDHPELVFDEYPSETVTVWITYALFDWFSLKEQLSELVPFLAKLSNSFTEILYSEIDQFIKQQEENENLASKEDFIAAIDNWRQLKELVAFYQAGEN
jgi:hypothetical protein